MRIAKRQSNLLVIGFRGVMLGGETVRALWGVYPIRDFINPATTRHIRGTQTQSSMRVMSLTEPILKPNR
jgi:hypothetical protein